MWDFIFMFVLILLGFGILVFLHELGHFLTARCFGVSIKEFAVGMGPTIFSKRSKKTDTVYALRALPIGGFVSMVGEDEASDDHNAFCNKSVWKRMLIVLAGPAMNLLLGLFLTGCLVMCQVLTPELNLASTTVAEFFPDASSSAQLQVHDTVLKVGSVSVHTGNELMYEIMNQGHEPVDLLVRRKGEKVLLEDVVFPTFSESGAVFGDYDFKVHAEQPTLLNIAKHTFFRSFSNVKTVFDTLVGLIGGRYGMESVSGPIGVADEIGSVVKEESDFRFLSVLSLGSLLTVNLGVFNLIPFPALDGGRFLFLCIEAVRRKPINRKIEAYVNFAGIVLLFAFMIVVTFKDIVKLFT